MENLELTQEWDKVFPKSNKVDHQKIIFHNRYGITLAADMYTPKNSAGKLSAIAVSGPFGAVKEQSSGLYAQTMAEFGFLTSPLTRPLPAKAAAVPVMWHPRTSTRKISVPRWIFCPCRKMLTPTASVSSAFAAGAAWQSMPLLWIPALRQPLP